MERKKAPNRVSGKTSDIQPKGGAKPGVVICAGLSCQAAWAQAPRPTVMKLSAARRGVEPGRPQARAAISHCLGLCDKAPAMIRDGKQITGPKAMEALRAEAKKK